jgi:hypothetical protein
MLAAMAVAALYWYLPERLTLGPSWIGVMVIMIGLAASFATHRTGRHNANRIASLSLLTAITAGLAWSLGMLVAGLPEKSEPPTELLRAAIALWSSNVLVFASWYWRLDAGGPHSRDVREQHTEGAFLFPQMTMTHRKKGDGRAWKPGFVDYLFLAFNTSTAFSPTDVPVLSRWAKLLMMVQSSISLGTIAILAARAINIL